MLRFCAAAIVILALSADARAGALLDAVKAGDLPGAEAAISQGADVNEKTVLQTPLVAAVRAANHNMIALLLDKGADPNKGAGSNTPLSMACGQSDPIIVQMLLEKGADARASTNTNTALHRAAEAGCLKCAELLVAAGADVNALTSDGIPAIHLASRAGYADIEALLLRPRLSTAPAHAHFSGTEGCGCSERQVRLRQDMCSLPPADGEFHTQPAAWRRRGPRQGKHRRPAIFRCPEDSWRNMELRRAERFHRQSARCHPRNGDEL